MLSWRIPARLGLLVALGVALTGATPPVEPVLKKAAVPGAPLPWGGAIPPLPPSPAYKGPYRATLSCAEGVKNFPFLKSWVEKLDNFIAPYEIGNTDGSLFFAIGVTTVGKNGVEAWKRDSVLLPVDWKQKGGKVESAWLGELPKATLVVRPGPGSSKPLKVGSKPDSSQMTARRSVGIDPAEPQLESYGAQAVQDSVDKIGSWARFWSQLLTPAEVELLSACTKDDCKTKFDASELSSIEGASHQYKLAQFKRLVEKRIEEFKTQGHIKAYEGSHKPLDWEDLPISPSFPAKFNTHFWLPAKRDTFGYEVLDAEPGHHKPVVGLFSRQCEKRGAGTQAYTACTDLVLYNNHYFDFWARVVFFFPWCDNQIALAYETMDIDQIKGSRIVRVLFGAEMRQLMGLLLETRLKRLHMLGF